MFDRRWLAANRLVELRSLTGDIDADLGSRRLKRWKESPGLAAPSLFETFLRAEGVSESEFLRLLSLKAESAEAPEWLGDVLEAFAKPLRIDPLLAQAMAQGDSTAPFLKWIWPLVSHYSDKLLGRIGDSAYVTLLLEPLVPHLRRLLHRTMILEVNIARLEERLTGATPAERFQSFLRSLEEPETRQRLLLEYPSLARRYRDTLHDWVEASAEFIERLRRDAALLGEKLGARGPVLRIQGNMGDAHRRGRSVIVAEFADSVKVVYKPRSLALDGEFQSFAGWLSEEGIKPQLKTYLVLDRGGYGWTEFVPFKSCETEDEVERFYQRQGAWLALLYVLGGTDLHLENVIASGEYPMNIDLETLFHPYLTSKNPSQSDEAAIQQMEDSVLSIGLLPSPVHLEGGQILDKSGLGASANQTLNFQVDGMTDTESDEIRIVKVPGRIGQIQSNPHFRGQPVSAANYRVSVKRGFTETYRFLERRCDQVRERIERFRGLPTRIVLRASSQYGALQAEALHPKLYRNSIERELLFSQLWAQSLVMPSYASVVPSEVRQLLRGDIPYFVSTTDSRDLRDSDGETYPGFLARSGFDVALARVDRLGEADLKKQIWFIDTAYASTAKVPREGMRWDEKLETVGVSSVLEAAEAAGRQLGATAVRFGEDSASWLSLRFKLENEEAGHYTLGVVEDDLYSGLAGIIFFLAYLGAITKNRGHRQLAEQGLSMLEKRIASGPANIPMGAFTGLGGFVYMYSHLAQLWDRPELLARADALLPSIEALIPSDTRFDWIAGSAGVIVSLLALGSGRAVRIARLCGEHILHASVIDGSRRRIPELPMQRGLSHGPAGVAQALSELSRATAEPRWVEAAAEFLNEEREQLKGGNWTDIPERRDQATWCHGAPGIALGRLLMSQAHAHPAFAADAREALAATLSAPKLENQILCHGSLGNLETLLTANVPDETIRSKADAILDDVRRFGWVSPLPPNVIEAGLMKGLAGIGFGFLRVAAPERVPSVLLLAGPRR